MDINKYPSLPIEKTMGCWWKDVASFYGLLSSRNPMVAVEAVCHSLEVKGSQEAERGLLLYCTITHSKESHKPARLIFRKVNYGQ